MAEFNLKVIKIFFSLVIFMLVLAMTSGMTILQRFKMPNWEKARMELAFWKYKRALAFETDPQRTESETAKSVPVLLYHGVVEEGRRKKDDTNISVSDFRSQMFALKKAGYQTVSLHDFHNFMKYGKTLPEKSFLLTFDDGRKDSYFPVDPILRALGFNAVIFAITGQSLSESTSSSPGYYLSRQEILEMEESGRWEIESHGDEDHGWENISAFGDKGHFLSNRLWLSEKNRLETEEEAKTRILNDLEISKRKIKKILGRDAIGFAYPFNDFGQETLNFSGIQKYISENIGNIYPLTFMQVSDEDFLGNYPDSNQIFVKRLDVSSKISATQLVNLLENGREKTLPYRDTFWNDQGWMTRWGSKKIWGDMIFGDAEGEKNGSLVVLQGSDGWKDYGFSAVFFADEGQSLFQIIRYKDDENYAACAFDVSGTRIIEKTASKEVVLAENTASTGRFSKNIDHRAEASVSGNVVSCSLDGMEKIRALLKSGRETGGIGFSTWDDSASSALIRVKNVEVSPILE